MPVHWTRSSIDTPSYPRSQNAFMAFSRTCWGSNAFFPAIGPLVFLLVKEYTTCWNEKSRMDIRSGRVCSDQLNMIVVHRTSPIDALRSPAKLSFLFLCNSALQERQKR